MHNSLKLQFLRENVCTNSSNIFSRRVSKQKFSSDLGYNREDITSLGVSDNFMPMTDAKVERTSTKKSNKAFDVSEKWFFHDDRLIPPKVAPPISAPPPFATSLDL